MASWVIFLTLICTAAALPTLDSTTYFNLAVPVCVKYNVSDAWDGRNVATKATSTTRPDPISGETQPHGNDWIGLFESGSCLQTDNTIDRHKCHIATRSVPKPQANPDSWYGQVCFSVDEYKKSGDYDVRYFYGDDPMIDRNCTSPEFAEGGFIEGCASPHFHWNGNGYVCNTHAGIEGSILYSYEVNATQYSCDCDPTAGTVDEQLACRQVSAACQRCALDSVATLTVSVLESFGIGATQMSMRSIPGFEIMLN